MLNRLLKIETRVNNEKHPTYKVVHALLDRMNFSFPVRINGKMFWIPIIYGMGFYNFLQTEPWLVHLLKKIYSFSEGAFLDVGANVGQTLLRFKSLGLNIPYIGFEPNAGAYFYLTELIKKNHFNRCQVFPLALSDSNHLHAFYSRHRSDVSSTLLKNYKSFATDDSQQLIFTVSGDEILKELGELTAGLIKIDVEGGELEVIRGLKGTLQIQRPFVLVEILPVYHLNSPNLRLRKKRQDILLQEMFALNYSVFRVKKRGSLTAIKEIEVHSSLKDSNYLFVPDEKQESVRQIFEIVE